MSYLKYTRLSIFFLTLSLLACHPKLYKADREQKPKTEGFKVVGYLSSNNLGSIDQIKLHTLTHLDLAFANPDENGQLVFRAEEHLSEVVRKAHNANVKVYLSIAGGGINEKLADNWLQVLQPQNRASFIGELMAFVEKYTLDGIDVDIEFNLLPTIGDLYTPFVLELRDALQAKGKGISSALNVSGLHAAVTQEALEAYDFINVMVYDKTGPWRPNTPGPHAPYSYAEEALVYWTKERNIPAYKLTLGVPFYGHDFDKVSSIAYKDLVEGNPENAYRDEVGAIFYNGIPTMVKKTKLAKDSFGGIMIWELHQDAQNELSLLQTITQTLEAGDCNEEEVRTYFADTDGDGFGNPKQPYQACKRPRAYVANKADCDDTDRKVNPKYSNCVGKID